MTGGVHFGVPARRGRTRCRLAALLLACALGCSPGDGPVYGEPGTPLPGLSATDVARFHAGAALFNKVFTPEEGVGPLLNENQCSACHTVPAIGGTTSFEFVTKATRYEGPAGGCNLLSHEGGENVRKKATPLLRAHGIEREPVPPSATEVDRFTTPFLFGLGLVEAIPDETILAAADAEDVDGDGISGRPGRTPDGRLARFGRKADHATLAEFVVGALRLEMGLTSPAKLAEAVMNGEPFPPGTDPAAEPEVDQRTVDAMTDFVRFLAPPTPRTPRSAAHRDTIATGRRIFGDLGCASCHTPAMRTGRSDNAAIDRKVVALYSDLLLHDMGPALAGVCGPTATPREVRTEMLMGLGHREQFLHNGRGGDLEEAILLHGGEAQAARDAFAALPWLAQRYVMWFLETL